jgi:hypothetical protein
VGDFYFNYMAENKKSFTAYCDWNTTFNSLPDDKAGQLIKHLFAYVNDEEPITDDLLINAVFANIKATLKRDLIKWKEKSEKNKQIAIDRWSKKESESNNINTNVCERIKIDANYTDSDRVSVSVNDSVNEIKENIEALPNFSFYHSLIKYGGKKELVSDWIKVRKNKRLTNTETAFNKFIKQVENSGHSINEVLEKCIEKSWGGFESDWFKKDLTSGYRKPTGGIRDSGLAF